MKPCFKMPVDLKGPKSLQLFLIYLGRFADLPAKSSGSSNHCAFMLCDFWSYSNVRAF